MKLFTSMLVLIGCAASLLSPAIFAAQSKPNVVLILMDNLGYGEIGVYGGGVVRGGATPNIDSIASDGLKLTNYNVETQCTPSRSALMTGRHAIRSGTHTIPKDIIDYGLAAWEETFAEVFEKAGYDTAMYGKWHLGQTPGRFPTDNGFDEWYGIPNSTDEAFWIDADDYQPDSHPLAAIPYVWQSKKGEIPTKADPYDKEMRSLIDGKITDKAVAFIKQRDKKSNNPFFLFLPMTQPHYPVIPHPDFAGKTGNGHWGDILTQMDAYTGRIMEALREQGLEENTIFVFTSDNGPEMTHPWRGWAGPWRGTYFVSLEGSLRVPFLLKWPAGIPGGQVSDEIVHVVDVFPTIAGLSKVTMPDDRIIDGIDMSEFFSGKVTSSGREGFPIYNGGRLQGVKWKNWKSHFYDQSEGNEHPKKLPFPMVHNLYKDPREERPEPMTNSWVRWPVSKVVADFEKSLVEEPPVPQGAPLSYKPGDKFTPKKMAW